VSDTTEIVNTTDDPGAPAAATRSRRAGAGLTSMVLPELKAMATSMGIKGISGMRKGDLVSAIAARQGGSGNGAAGSASTTNGAAADNGRSTPGAQQGPAPDAGPAATDDTAGGSQRLGRRRAARTAGAPDRAGEPAADTGGGQGNGAATLFDSTQPSADQLRNADQPTAGQRGATDQASDSDQRGATDQRSTTDQRSATDQRSTTDQRGTARNGSADDSGTLRTDGTGQTDRDDRQDGGSRRNRRNRRDRDSFDSENGQAGQDRGDQRGQQSQVQSQNDRNRQQGDRNGQQARQNDRNGQQDDRNGQQNDRQNDRQGQQNDRNGQQNDRLNDRNGQQTRQNDRNGQQDDRDGDDDGRGGRRRNRYRDRNRRGSSRDQRGATTYADTTDTEVRDDDVLVPVAGILDVLDSYAFIRTSGYLSGPNDVYVSLSQVRRGGLRRGDHVTGVIRAPRDGEQARQKFNALIRLDTVNGLDPETARNRPEFTKLTPLYPNDRLRLETESHLLTTRVIDLVMPVGKGQRALIVSPPKAGKTMVMQAIANAITTNNPECHLMVVLVDERPEEVTDMQRSVKGEVIASTFDRPPADHTMVAELSIERAKRLVEMGRDVVVLLDSITRLGRAYNLAAPASGRILSGGVDSTALFPPKRFLGAARNIENGGSLTIFASALVETGSAGDTVIFEEFKGTGNAELRLDRRLADKRIFPAIDVDQSSTRKEDLLLSPDELAVTVKLRRVLSALDAQQALELVLDRLRKSHTNIEFLMQVAKNTPGND
jgi:transcription termination factor Rho